jgi:hypothetical protein
LAIRSTDPPASSLALRFGVASHATHGSSAKVFSEFDVSPYFTLIVLGWQVGKHEKSPRVVASRRQQKREFRHCVLRQMQHRRQKLGILQQIGRNVAPTATFDVNQNRLFSRFIVEDY